MANMIPSYDTILSSKVKPEEGELHLLNFLDNHLDESFEVYFNPYMNGDRPDIIVMKRNQGVLIIEVKDYNLEKYELDGRKNWKVKNRTHNYTIKSPIQQVLKYKNNLFELHIENLLELKIQNIKNFNIVFCAVYFHNASKEEIDNLLVKPFKHDKKYLKFLKYNIDLLGRDTLNNSDFNKILRNGYLISERPSFYFTDKIYYSFKRFLKPPLHLKEHGRDFIPSKEQQRVVYDSTDIKSKLIKGVVGSGKTTVLALRAVQLLKKTRGKILILTYNITLKNFIHDKISMVKEEFPWDSFIIQNYHSFVNAELNNLGIPVTVPQGFEEYTQREKEIYFEENYYSNKSLFKQNDKKIKAYDAILIDEIQDYKRSWMEIIKEFFIVHNGEYILFGDVKQNIYNNEIINKQLSTNIGKYGSVRFLKRCYRSNSKIKDLAVEYQKNIFKERYEIDDFNTSKNFKLEFERNKNGHLNYIFLPDSNKIKSLYTVIHENAINRGISPNDITVLGQTIKLLRNFDAYYRYSSNERTNTMFETNEIIFRMGLNYLKSNQYPIWIKEALSLIGRLYDNDKKTAFNQLSILFTILDLNSLYNNQFDNKLEHYCKKFRTTKKDFLKIIDKYSTQYEQFKKDFNPSRLSKNLKLIRDNKKIHFWFNSGTIKLSTVHSFKGWESELLFLIIEPKYQNASKFEQSFDEIIYTGLTRSRSNLIILNYGNHDYHLKLKEMVDLVNT